MSVQCLIFTKRPICKMWWTAMIMIPEHCIVGSNHARCNVGCRSPYRSSVRGILSPQLKGEVCLPPKTPVQKKTPRHVERASDTKDIDHHHPAGKSCGHPWSLQGAEHEYEYMWKRSLTRCHRTGPVRP